MFAVCSKLYILNGKMEEVNCYESCPWPCLVAATACSRNLVLSKIKTPTYFVSGIEGRNIASSDDSYVLQVQVVSCCYQFCSDLRAQHKPGLYVKSSHKPLIGRFT